MSEIDKTGEEFQSYLKRYYKFQKREIWRKGMRVGKWKPDVDDQVEKNLKDSNSSRSSPERRDDEGFEQHSKKLEDNMAELFWT